MRAASCSTRWTGRRCIESRAACSKIAQICFKFWFSVVPLRIHMGRIQPKAIPTHLLRCQLTTLHLSDRPPPEHPSATHPTTPSQKRAPQPPFHAVFIIFFATTSWNSGPSPAKVPQSLSYRTQPIKLRDLCPSFNQSVHNRCADP